MSGSSGRRVALLAHDKFPHEAKTAQGILRYGDQEVAAVIDREKAGSRVRDHLPAVADAPIVGSVGAVEDAAALVIGIAPIGGGFDESWRPDVRRALERGWDVVSGLHDFLEEDEEFRTLATDHDAEIWDVRRPPDHLGVAAGIADSVDAQVIATVGTDCSVGKMTTTFELVRAMRDHGHDAAVIPTGQTGIMIEGWGYAIDRVVADFAPSAVEELVLERGNDHDVLVVEGQASITHPAYSPDSAAILHGAMPDALVLCHEADRERVGGFERFEIPPLPAVVSLYESMAEPVSQAPVVGCSVNTRTIENETAARQAVESVAHGIERPATDVIRFGTAPLVDALI